MLQHTRLAVEQLTVALFIGSQQHQRPLEMEHDQIDDQVAEAGLLQCTSTVILRLVWAVWL